MLREEAEAMARRHLRKFKKMVDEEKVERCVKLLAQYVIDGEGVGLYAQFELRKAIDEVLDELDTLDLDVTNEFGSSADDPTGVQKGLVEWKRWRKSK